MTFEVGGERGGAEIGEVLEEGGVMQEAEQGLVHHVLKHKVVVIIGR